MPVLTKAPTLGDLLKFELSASYCRETVTLKAGTSYPLGAVLGKITASGKYRLSPAAEVVSDEGAETAVAVLLEAVDATGADKTGLIVARGPVILSKAALVFDASVDQAAEMFDNWGGSVPKLVPDNLKTGISHAGFYDPAINRSYLELARHYGIGVVPARVRKPRDKPLAENAVQQVERWVLAPLRNRVFFSLDDLNRAIRQGLAALNDRPLSADSTLSRAKLFEAHEKPLLKALPPEPFEIGRWCRHKVPPDYHLVIEGVAYSVPFRLIGKTVDVHRTASLVSIFHKAERVASHARRLAEPATVRLAVTLDEHRPASHRAVLRLTPEAVRATITAFGGAVAVLAELIFQDADHPEQAARQVAGLIRLGACHGTAALQAAAAAALGANVRSYRYVRQWLASGQITDPMSPADPPGGGAGLHQNVRGSTYYH